MLPLAGRPIIDRTGLTGVYAVKLRVQRMPQRADAVPGPDDPPSVFTAVPEQLGLKFESSKTTVQALAAAVQGIDALNHGDVGVRSLQEHAEHLTAARD